jgi:protease-4
MSKKDKIKEDVIGRKQQAILRFLSGAKMHIDPDWGMEQLQRVLMFHELSDGAMKQEDDICAEEKNKTQHTTIYSSTGDYVGEFSVLDDIPEKSIAVVSMSGTMMVQDAMCSYGMKSMDKRLRALYRDTRISGIIIDMDSGGGYSTAGDILFNAIKDKNKPVVIHAQFMASAALKGSLAANEIIAASESTTIGSIGTMMVLPKWYIEEAGENEIELYSRKSPNKNGAWRALKNGDFEPFIDELTKNDEVFMNQVKKYRKLRGTRTEVKETLSGATFMGVEAKRRGLIDGIGSLNYAIKRINSHLKYS